MLENAETAVLVDPEQAAPAKVPLDAPDGALEHGADLARLQVAEPLPAQDLRLAEPAKAVRWRKGLIVRGPERLPVAF